MCKEHRIIEDAMMVQDRSFGKARSARGVLNLGGIPWLDRGLPSTSLLLADLPAIRDHFLEERRSPAVLLEMYSTSCARSTGFTVTSTRPALAAAISKSSHSGRFTAQTAIWSPLCSPKAIRPFATSLARSRYSW